MVQEDVRATGALGKPRHLVLGMDPGVASCGFALLDMNNHEILEMGTRLFDSPVEDQTKQSLAVTRRGFRSVRRNIDRTQERLKRCLKLLQGAGIVPADATKEYFHTVKGDKPPLELRVAGLDRLLNEREWAIVLYSLCKRRGYIPRGAGNAGETSDEGKVLSAIKENTEAFGRSGCRTVGEWLAGQDRSRNRGGAYEQCVTHEQLADELHVLFAAQREHGSTYASEELKKSYLDVFDWQKPSASFDELTYAKVGSCVYFADEKRAARCTLTSELVAAYGALGNVVIEQADGTKRTLTAAERDACISVLFSPVAIKGNKHCKVTYARLRAQLDLSERDTFKGVKRADEKKREPYEPRAWRTVRTPLAEQDKQELAYRLREDRAFADAVLEALVYASSGETLRARLEQLDVSAEDVDALCALPYASRVFNGYGTRSKFALDMLLEAFEEPEVLTLTAAEDATGLGELRRADAGIARSSRLLPYEAWLAATGKTNNNPVVLRAMAQMRKVVNAVCREWGVPNEIHVELDRELAKSKTAQQKIRTRQNENQKDNERIAAVIAERKGCSPGEVKLSLIVKYGLWEEQNGFDAYTGQKIEVERLIDDQRYTEVDHILPFSRTGDNARSNKVLVLAATNQNKRERTPYEWMTSGEETAPSWNEYETRVMENKKLAPRKHANLLERALDEKEAEFLQRSITDTAYMSREVCAYLADSLAFPDDGSKVHVVPTKGQATAWLRRSWGLNFGLSGEKDRSDDRHHATDACVIAACSRSLVIKTARYSEQKHRIQQEERDALLAASKPWPEFTEDVRAAREHVIPTRFVAHKGTGQVFEQTIYSYVETEEKSGRHVLQAKKGGEIKRTDPKANVVLLEDGKSARLVGDMVCLRLWHDPLARPNGKVKGRWYADPIYVADLPALQSGTYIPRIAKARTARNRWQPIPEHVLAGKPVEIYLRDAVQVGEKVGRFDGFGIATATWKFVDIRTGNKIDFPGIARGLGNEPDQIPHVIREDVLGHCWRS